MAPKPRTEEQKKPATARPRKRTRAKAPVTSGKAPDGAAARLLEIFERYPEIAEELMERVRG